MEASPPPTYTDKARSVFCEQDELEAHLINDMYARVEKNWEGPAGEVSALAVRLVNEGFDPVNKSIMPSNSYTQDYPELIIPESKTVGYETGKQARRWLEYRYAYLSDIAQTYEDLDLDNDHRRHQHGLPEEESYQAKLIKLLEEQFEYSDHLKEEDSPYYWHFLAQMEKERRAFGESPLFDISHEKTVALYGLVNVLDAVAGNQSDSRTEGTIQGAEYYRLDIKKIGDKMTHYHLVVADSAIDMTKEPDELTHEDMLCDYEIVLSDHKIEGYVTGPGPIGPLLKDEIAELTKGIAAPSQRFDFSRPALG